MAEFTADALQNVGVNQNVLFTTEIGENKCCNGSISHRNGSGLITLRGMTKQCRAKFKVFFSGNIRIPAGGTVAPIALAIATDGEGVNSSSMISTPAAAEQFNNVSSAIYLDVPCGCCVQVSVKNISTQSIDVQNANLIVERVA